MKDNEENWKCLALYLLERLENKEKIDMSDLLFTNVVFYIKSKIKEI